MIRYMMEKGMSVTEIAIQLGIDRKAVRRYMNSDKVPRLSHNKRKSKFDLVRPIIKGLIDKYNLSAVRTLKEVRKWSYDGQISILRDYYKGDPYELLRIREEKIRMGRISRKETNMRDRKRGVMQKPHLNLTRYLSQTAINSTIFML